jgi:hypothetical protein
MARYREFARTASGWNGIRNSKGAPTPIHVFAPDRMKRNLTWIPKNWFFPYKNNDCQPG